MCLVKTFPVGQLEEAKDLVNRLREVGRGAGYWTLPGLGGIEVWADDEGHGPRSSPALPLD